jgi:hypothetical protein
MAKKKVAKPNWELIDNYLVQFAMVSIIVDSFMKDAMAARKKKDGVAMRACLSAMSMIYSDRVLTDIGKNAGLE